MLPFLIILILLPIAILYFSYTKVIQNKNMMLEALSGIDVQLKKRYDLIPNILTIAKRFMEHETELFDKITALRTNAMKSKVGSKEKFQAEASLETELRALMVNVENYPTLKSDATMVQAMTTYNEVEEHIAASRRFYNSALTQLRNSVQIFPGTLFAHLAGDISSYSYFETDKQSREKIDASKYL